MRSKLEKTEVLLKNRRLRKHIPLTKELNKESLSSMLNQFGMVYLKPDIGRKGHGVIQIKTKVNNGKKVFYYHLGVSRKEFDSYESLYEAIQEHVSKKKYLVQQGIDLLSFKNRPFDIRVMVQKNPKGEWETTGVIGRVAHPRKIVTNGSSGGTSIAVDTLLLKYLKNKDTQSLIRSLEKLGCRIATYLEQTYPSLKEIGVDVALDHKFNQWILEVNTAPQIFGFKELEDQRIYQKMLQYRKANYR